MAINEEDRDNLMRTRAREGFANESAAALARSVLDIDERLETAARVTAVLEQRVEQLTAELTALKASLGETETAEEPAKPEPKKGSKRKSESAGAEDPTS